MGIKVTCDTCGGDLTHDNGADAWRIDVNLVRIPSDPNSNFRFDVMTYPPIREGGVFCSAPCLLTFLSNMGWRA